MQLLRFRLPAAVLLLCAAPALSGCGGSPDFTPPKTELTEQEKQQVKELDEHRQREWSPPPQPSGS